MKVVALTHSKKLGYPNCPHQLLLSDLSVKDPDNTTVITFAQIYGKKQSITAMDRLDEIPSGDLVLSCLDDSPLAPLIFWDAAHQLNTGHQLYLQASDNIAELLSRSYFSSCFQEGHPIPEDAKKYGLRIFTKTAPLPAENDRGLDAWSFCIPTGDGDPSLLNLCIERILSLNIPEFEIVLCGRPREDFLYWGQVRIVGEEISAPPIHITRKKNVLAETARFPNLCIMHDRVMLPRNFHQAVHRFGDHFPFTAFQSFWFADKWHAVARRYSDAGVALEAPTIDLTETRMSRSELPLLEFIPLAARHPARADFGQDYLTGSLYLCKKSVWKHVPQNERLYWQEYEDLEQAFCAALAGIPSRLNPFGMTTTSAYRSVMHTHGVLTGVECNGRVSGQRAPQEWWGFPRKPHLGINEEQAIQRLSEFATRYTGDDTLVRKQSSLSGLRRYYLIARLLWATKGDMSHLIEDWYKYVLCEAVTPCEKRDLQDVLNNSSGSARQKLQLLRHTSLTRQVFNNPFSSPFKSAEDNSSGTNIVCRGFGSVISALWLKLGCRHSSLRLSFFELWKTIFSDAVYSPSNKAKHRHASH